MVECKHNNTLILYFDSLSVFAMAFMNDWINVKCKYKYI